MEERRERRSTARKALSDLTNTTFPPPNPRRNIPSPAPLKPHSSAGIKPSSLTAVNISKKIQNPSIHKNVNSEEKSNTSTGSNISPVSDSVPPTPAPVQSVKTRRPSAKIQKNDEQTRKDKEKPVGSAPIIHVSASLTSEVAKLSSSVVSGSAGYDSGPAAVVNQKLDEQKRKDKGKMVVETPIIHTSVPLTSCTLLASSCNLSLSRPSTIHSHQLDAQASKDKGQMVQKTLNIEGSGPRTPPSHILSSSAASGTDDQEKRCITVYKQRRGPQRKMHADPSISLLLSCPPDKRMLKKSRIELNDGGAGSHSGSHTDPLPLHKKKRSRNKRDESMHVMQDEVEKLKAYFADVDAFELPEEVASESELE